MPHSAPAIRRPAPTVAQPSLDADRARTRPRPRAGRAAGAPSRARPRSTAPSAAAATRAASPSALGPDGTLICIDRDPAAEARFDRVRRRGALPDPLHRRRLRGRASRPARRRHPPRHGLHGPRNVLDAGRRLGAGLLLLLRRAARHADGHPPAAHAADLVNEWPESRIAQVLRRFGEERYAGGIAREIVRRRPLTTTSELVDAIKAGMPASARFGGGHPAKRTFQAIRIAVNGELDSLDDALPTGLGDAAGRRPPRRDLLPLARGPPRQALPRRARHAAASARPSCRSASAGASPKPSC